MRMGDDASKSRVIVLPALGDVMGEGGSWEVVDHEAGADDTYCAGAVMPSTNALTRSRTEARGLAQFKDSMVMEDFDVAKAECAKPEDTQRMLACIEAGFGSYEPFNNIVRGVLKQVGEEPKRVPLSTAKVAPEV